MEGENNSSLAKIVVILSLLLIVVTGYVVFDKVISNKGASRNISIKQLQNCKYTKLKDAGKLTDTDKDRIILALETTTGPLVDKSTLKIVNVSDTPYLYSVSFETIEKVGSYQLEDYVWSEKGVYKHLRSGSDFTVDQYTDLLATINNTCNSN